MTMTKDPVRRMQVDDKRAWSARPSGCGRDVTDGLGDSTLDA